MNPQLPTTVLSVGWVLILKGLDAFVVGNKITMFASSV